MQSFLADLAQQVRLLDAAEFWIISAITLLLCLAGAATAVWMLTRVRQIQDTPTSKIRSAAQGYVELEGLALQLPGEPVVSPLSGQPCAWWQYSIEEKRSSYSNGRRTTTWTTIETATSDDLFELRDDTGSCVVDPEGAHVIPNQSLSWYGHTRRPVDRPASSRLIGIGKFRYREKIIKPGSALYTLGWFRTEGGLAHNFNEREALRDLLAEWKRDEASLLRRFDQDGDGQIDLQEWEQVRAAALEKVRASHLQRAADPDIHVLCRPPRRMRYILSTLPQDKLISRSRGYLILGLLSFFGAGSVLVFIATARGVL